CELLVNVGSYEYTPRPSLYERHSFTCCEQSATPSLYMLSQDYLSFAAVSRPATQIARSNHLLNRERTRAHANDQAHSQGRCLVMANRTEYRGQDCPDRRTTWHKGPDKISRP